MIQLLNRGVKGIHIYMDYFFDRKWEFSHNLNFLCWLRLRFE
jgi:hypothetical protein